MSCSGSAKSNRIGVSTIPGSPQGPSDIPDQPKSEAIYPLPTNPSPDMNENDANTPILEDQENLGNSDDEDEQGQMPVDEAQTECKF